MKIANGSIKLNIIWNSTGNIIYLGMQWLISVFIARILGYNDAGIFSLAMSITNIFTCIALFGIRNFQVSDLEGKYSDMDYIKSRIITCICAVILCSIYISLLPYTLIQKSCIVIYMLYRASESFADVLHGIDQKSWRMDIVGKSYFLRGTFMFVIAAALAFITENIILVILGMTIITTVIIFYYDLRQTLKLVKTDSKNNGRYKLLLVESIPLVIYMIMQNSMGSIPRLFLERISGSDMLGIYSSIASPTLIIQIGASYLFIPLVGVFADYIKARDNSKFMKLFIKIYVIIALLSLASIVIGGIFGEFGLKVLFGISILPYSYILLPIILCTILTALSWFLCMILTVFRDMKGLIIGNSIGLAFNFILAPKYIRNYSLNGTSYILIISLIIQIVILQIFIFVDITRKKPLTNL